jgi:NAD(P)-dependent dehydrogenase (short-subunit alcohol dehydrogenase family)
MTDPTPPPAAETTRPFAGRTALVVGASRGIGAATARMLGRRGARVLLASRDVPALETVASEIRDAGGESRVLRVDLAVPESIARLGPWIDAAGGRLDIAFNNAGEGAPPQPFAEVPPETFERVVRTTVEGTFRAMREELPRMLESGGAIVNMSSTAGVGAFAGGAPYIAAKHAILGLTKSAAIDYAARGVRVNAVAPGPIETDRIRALPEAYREPIRAAVPMRRIGQPDEVASVVAWLCSDEAKFVTGATVFVDGGRLAGWA